MQGDRGFLRAALASAREQENEFVRALRKSVAKDARKARKRAASKARAKRKRAEPPTVKPVAVSIPEAARMLGFSENHFRQRVLPDLGKIRGTRPRILVADVEEWAAAHKDSDSASKAASGASGSASPRSATNTRPASKPNPRNADRAKQLLERASRSTRRRSPANG